ncbi:hypothetical protein MMC07_006648 [Pseudocyphellaria aurata]|nr:hypothetical protein [Pseudocyphellaria aurata]
MSRPLAVAEQEAYSLFPSNDVQSLIQSERDLYPSVFYDFNDSFHSELGEDNKTNPEKLEVCHKSREETAVCPLMEANITERADATNFFDSHNVDDIDLTSVLAPRISHSNPETPTEPLEMSFDTKPLEMTRNLSEQSPLAPRMARYANSELDGKPINQGQNEVLTSAAANPPKSRAGTPGPRSRVSSISGVSGPTARPQASPEQTNRHEPTPRFSNARQHIGPSGLRNSISAPSDGPLPSSSSMYPDPVQANLGIPSLSEQVQSHGTQYRHSFRSQSPQIWTQDQHASAYKAPVQLHNRSNSTGSFTSHDQFPEIFNTNSSRAIHSSPFSEDRLHANMTQENVNFPRYQNELMLHQAPTYLPYANQHLPQIQRRASNFDPNFFHAQIMKPEDYSSGAGHRLKYQSLEDARREKSVSTHNPLIDNTVPQSAEDDCHYVEKMVASMLLMDRAEDNAGMKRTWDAMKRDRDKVEKASWEILNLCKERHRRNGPFEMSPKVTRQYDTFQDRVESICNAMETQKTLCKHLLRQPFNEEVVEDPVAAVSRIKNNRKVNHGKKEAIDKGREALGEKGHGKGRRTTKVTQDESDDEFERDDDEDGSPASAQTHSKKRSLSRSHAPIPRRQASADDPHDQSYREGSAPKRARRPSRSVYQLNKNNQMIDTTQQEALKVEHEHMQRSSHDQLYADPNSPYGLHGITGLADARHGDPLFGSNDQIDFGQHQQTQGEGRRRVTRH